MSLYNLVMGENTGLRLLVAPFLPVPPEAFPRYRDVFLLDEDQPNFNQHVFVYTRTGGNNREAYGDETLSDAPNFVSEYDDTFDNTYCTFAYSVPEDLIADYNLIRDLPPKGPINFSERYWGLMHERRPDQSDSLTKFRASLEDPNRGMTTETTTPTEGTTNDQAE